VARAPRQTHRSTLVTGCCGRCVAVERRPSPPLARPRTSAAAAAPGTRRAPGCGAGGAGAAATSATSSTCRRSVDWLLSSAGRTWGGGREGASRAGRAGLWVLFLGGRQASNHQGASQVSGRQGTRPQNPLPLAGATARRRHPQACRPPPRRPAGRRPAAPPWRGRCSPPGRRPRGRRRRCRAPPCPAAAPARARRTTLRGAGGVRVVGTGASGEPKAGAPTTPAASPCAWSPAAHPAGPRLACPGCSCPRRAAPGQARCGCPPSSAPRARREPSRCRAAPACAPATARAPAARRSLGLGAGRED
jgi:hypothetical protein